MNESFMDSESELVASGEWKLQLYILFEVIEKHLTMEGHIRTALQQWRLFYTYSHKIERTECFSTELKFGE